MVDDSGFNKIWMPAETDENGNNLIYTGVFGIMYESPHYSSFKMRNWLRYDANGFGVLKISATDGNPLDLYVGIVNAPFVNYLPEGGEIKCQLYALPLNVRFYADADAATNDGKFLPMKLMSWILVVNTITDFILVLPVRMACMMKIISTVRRLFPERLLARNCVLIS